MGSYLLKILQDNNETQLLAELAWMIKFDQAVEKNPGAILRASVEREKEPGGTLSETCSCMRMAILCIPPRGNPSF